MSRKGKNPKLPDWLGVAIALGYFVLLFTVCVVGPVWLARYLGAVWGVVGAVAVLPVWVYAGPRPMPGFLSGIVALGGLFTLLGCVIANVVRYLQGG